MPRAIRTPMHRHEDLQRGSARPAECMSKAIVLQHVEHAGPGQPPKPVEPIVPLPEFGWAPVTFPFPGGTEPMVMGMIDGAPMFHWHFDTFDLPKLPPPANAAPPPAPPPPTGNSLLSSSRLCKNQAFRFKTKLFGFQYHFEMTADGIAAMLANAKEDWTKVLGLDG